ncbi:MAG: hypothetical protein E6Q69_06810 [Aquipseudomonas alcaligenes]|uniref:Uncharacterized protein n=1 Tax=Aquipseudomonas alcaligenes TaxID=43263 RepID=A0A5C7W9F1_AQUAC|nr:MAG: hypothetical protein E6Q69_06810 [Pseudomonas alcaligenes]
MTDKEKADQAATLGHYVRVYSPSHELGLSFPPLAIKGLALELVGMLREVLPALEVSVVSYAIAGSEATDIGAATQRAKHRVIEAREAESPGAAFLDGIGLWPFDSKPKQE